MASTNNNKPLAFLVSVDCTTFMRSQSAALMHRAGNIFALFLLLSLLFCISGCSQQQSGARVLPTPHWLEDKSGDMTLDEVVNKDLSTQWNKAAQDNPNFGFTNSVMWFSLPFENASDKQLPMLLEVAFPLHDRIDVHILNGKQVVQSYRTGDQQRFAERPLNHRHFLFPHTVSAHSKLRAIIRVQTTDTMYLPVNVWDNEAFITQDQHLSLLLGLFFGALLIMLVYNLFLFLSTQHKSYLNYVWFIGAILYLQLTQKNLGFQYLWPDQPFFNHLSFPLSSLLALATGCLFLMHFLDLGKKTNAGAFYIFNVIIWFALAGMLASAAILYLGQQHVPYTLVILATAVFAAVATIVIMITLVNLALKGNHSARILSLAWLSLLVGSLLFALGRIGVPLPMILTENAMLIGSTFEAALISFALAMHIKKEREGRIQAQALALENERKTLEAQNSLLRLQEGVRQQLEDEVEERTQKLQSAMLRLEDANHKLDNLARLDALTGLSNRRDFDQTFNQQWQNAMAAGLPISLLMADIDYFKKLNDNHGHLFGDHCLVEVAAIIKQSMHRPDYLAARFGGEEFIMLLPNADATAANDIAETIRHRIEALRLKNDADIPVRFTISIGIANMIPVAGASSADLVACADEALYKAKENGRNQVVGPTDYLLSAACQESSSLTSTAR